MDYTLLMLAFVSSCSFAGCLAAKVYMREMHKNTSPENLKRNDINSLIKNFTAVRQERKDVSKNIDDICSLISELSKQSSTSPSSQNTFFKYEKKAPQLTSDDVELKELFSLYNKLLNSYPDFSKEQEQQDPDYIVRVNQQLTEHHIMTMELSGKLMERLIEIKSAQLRQCPLPSENTL